MYKTQPIKIQYTYYNSYITTVSKPLYTSVFRLLLSAATTLQAEVFPFFGNITGNNFLPIFTTSNNDEILMTAFIRVREISIRYHSSARLLSLAFALGICSASDFNTLS